MKEEGDVHVGYSLAQHAWQEHEVVVVYNNNVTRLVRLDNFVGKLLVHSVVVGPLNPLFATVRRFVLLVVEQGVEVVFSISSPPHLVLKGDTLIGELVLVRKPYWHGANRLAVPKLVLKAQLVFAWDVESVYRGRGRETCVGVNGNGRRERIQRGDTNGGAAGGIGILRRGRDILGKVNLSRPSDNGMMPWRGVGRKMCERIVESRLTATGFEILQVRNKQTVG